MKKVIKVLKISVIVLLLIILILNLSIMIQSKINPDKVPSIFGYKPFVVTSGSMESYLNIGDLVFVKDVKVNEVKVNDIIAFRDDENIINIVNNDNNMEEFNNNEDNSLENNNIIKTAEEIEETSNIDNSLNVDNNETNTEIVEEIVVSEDY